MRNGKLVNQKNLPKSPFPHQLAFVLASPLRRIFTNREKIIKEAGIQKGFVVLEIGCGPGFFTEAISKTVGKEGKVYAVDVQKEMLEKAEKRLRRVNTKDNILLILSSSSQINLPDDSIDVAFAVNVFEEVEKEGESENTIKELWRLLKKNGVLFFAEHKFGGTASIIKSVLAVAERSGLSLIYKKEGLFSVQARFIRY